MKCNSFLKTTSRILAVAIVFTLFATSALA
jgi:hypothetical protein